MARKMFVAVSKAALVARINRALKRNEYQLKAARSERARFDLGDYYVVDVRQNLVMDKDVDLEGYAREIDVLKPYERLEE